MAGGAAGQRAGTAGGLAAGSRCASETWPCSSGSVSRRPKQSTRWARQSLWHDLADERWRLAERLAPGAPPRRAAPVAKRRAERGPARAARRPHEILGVGPAATPAEVPLREGGRGAKR